MVVGIPARLESTRFPRKLLHNLNNIPILRHVWNVTKDVFGSDDVFICSGDQEILELAQAWGARTFLSRQSHLNGTERVAEMVFSMGISEVINVQADDPTLTEGILEQLANASYGNSQVVTPVYKIPAGINPSEGNLVKVVLDHAGKAMYFSRSIVPASREGVEFPLAGHVGLYKFTSEALREYVSSGPTELEETEKLEQLRFLYYGMTIQTFNTPFIPSPVDCQDDLVRLEQRMTWRA